jgi:hypothetical protein
MKSHLVLVFQPVPVPEASAPVMLRMDTPPFYRPIVQELLDRKQQFPFANRFSNIDYYTLLSA